MVQNGDVHYKKLKAAVPRNAKLQIPLTIFKSKRLKFRSFAVTPKLLPSMFPFRLPVFLAFILLSNFSNFIRFAAFNLTALAANVTTHYQQAVPFDLKRTAWWRSIRHHRALQACLNYWLSSQTVFRRRQSAHHSPNSGGRHLRLLNRQRGTATSIYVQQLRPSMPALELSSSV